MAHIFANVCGPAAEYLRRSGKRLASNRARTQASRRPLRTSRTGLSMACGGDGLGWECGLKWGGPGCPARHRRTSGRGDRRGKPDRTKLDKARQSGTKRDNLGRPDKQWGEHGWGGVGRGITHVSGQILVPTLLALVDWGPLLVPRLLAFADAWYLKCYEHYAFLIGIHGRTSAGAKLCSRLRTGACFWRRVACVYGRVSIQTYSTYICNV